MRGLAVIAIALTGCEARLGGDVVDDALPGDGPLFSGDTSEPDAPLGDFGQPQLITVAGDQALPEDDGSLSHSGLELVFAVASNGQKDLFYTSRPNLQSAFGPATKLPLSGATTSEETPRFSDDDLTLYFAKTVGTNNLDIHQVTRPNAGVPNFGTATVVPGVNSAGVDKWFMPCVDNRYLIIIGADIGEGVRGQGAPTLVAELNSPQGETGPFVTKDCLNVTFASGRGGTTQLYTSSRTAVGQPFSTPVLLDIASFAMLGGQQQDPFISDDNRTFVFVSDIGGTNDVYISTR